MNHQPQTNQSNSLTKTIKVSIAISIILGITLIILVASTLIHGQCYFATIPRIKRQLRIREIVDDSDFWDGESQFKHEVPTESEAGMGSYVDLIKKKDLSVDTEPVEMDSYIVIKGTQEETRRPEVASGLGLGLGNMEVLVESKELDAGTTLGKGEIARKFNVQSNACIVGI